MTMPNDDVPQTFDAFVIAYRQRVEAQVQAQTAIWVIFSVSLGLWGAVTAAAWIVGG